VVTLSKEGKRAVSGVIRVFLSSSGVSALVDRARLEVRFPRSNPIQSNLCFLLGDLGQVMHLLEPQFPPL
jgi:hypothetical protein